MVIHRNSNIILLFLSLIIFLSSCDNKINEITLEKEDVMNRIIFDLDKNNFYPDATNEFSYSEKYLNDYLNGAKISFKSKSKNEHELYTFHRSQLFEHYQLYGYEIDYLTDLESSIMNYDLHQVGDPVKTMENGGLITNLESQIISEYVSIFTSQSLSYDEFSDITSVFETHISNSNFSNLEKRNMLTIFNVIKDLQYKIENDPSYSYIKINKLFSNGRPDDDTVCAGNVITGLLFGAATGNGPGAAIGMLAGLWADYTYGCFDDTTIF